MDEFEYEIRARIEQGQLYDDKRLSSETVSSRPHQRSGLSSRSVRRFCHERSIGARRVSDDALDSIVASRLSRVGHTYGRQTMHGLLRAQGVRASQMRVAASLQRTHPFAHWQRQQNMDSLINPFPYSARYFGDKIHLDQNEKLVMYGVVGEWTLCPMIIQLNWKSFIASGSLYLDAVDMIIEKAYAAILIFIISFPTIW